MHPATLQDVADKAGVSRSTVSSVLNGGCSTTRTSEATRERVRQAAAELAYRPNAVARSLRHRVMHTIGFYNGFGYIDARNPFLSALIAGMHRQCDQSGCDLLIHQVSNRDDQAQQMQDIIGGKVDGVVLYTRYDDPLVDMLVARRFAAVAIADGNPNIPSVCADDEGGSRMIARRMAARGHRRVMYRLSSVDRMSANRRCEAFMQEAKALGLDVKVGISADFDGALSEEEAGWMSAPDGVRPTAIACWCDGNAIAAYRHCRGAGWTDVDVIGFDGFEIPGMPTALTTVYVPWDTVASTAVDTVHKIIAGQPVPPRITVPVTLVEGETG